MPNGIPPTLDEALAAGGTIISDAPPTLDDAIAAGGQVISAPEIYGPPPTLDQALASGGVIREPVMPEQEDVPWYKEGYRAVVGGVLDAVNQFADMYQKQTEQFIPEEVKLKEPLRAPKLKEPETFVGKVLKDITQFTAGFVPVVRAARSGIAAKSLIGQAAEAEAAAVVAGQAVLDPHEDRLSNLIESYPSLRNPVTNFLQAKPSDSDAEARLKMALEDLGVGAAFTGFLGSLRFMRNSKRALGDAPTKSGDETIDAQKTAIQEEQAAAGIEPQPKETIIPEVETPTHTTPAAEQTADFAGNINLDRLDTTDSVKEAIQLTADGYDEFVPARRGVVSHEETRKLANSLGMTEDELIQRRKGEAFNAHEALAARDLMVKSGEDLIVKAKVLNEVGGEDAASAFQEALIKHAAIQEQIAGVTAEAGRALNSFKILAQSRRRGEAVSEIVHKAGGQDKLENVAKILSDLETPEQLAKASREAFKATTSDKAYEVWINALLSGPQTHAVNITSNGLVSLWTIPEEFLMASVGAFRKNNKVRFREATAQTYGMMKGARDGLKLAWKTLKEGEPPDFASKVEARKQKAISGKKGEFFRLPTRFLAAEDQFFRAIAYRGKLHEYAMRKGLNEGLKGDKLAARMQDIINNPPPDIFRSATKHADYMTFQSDLGKKGRMVQNLVQTVPGLRYIAPFIKTPANIIKFAGERSIAAPIMKEFRDAIKEGGIARDRALARMTIGTATSLGVAGLAMDGHITGGGPMDYTAKNQLRLEGWQPYSIKIGDKYYAYNRLEPLGMLFGIAADIVELSRNPEIYEANEGDIIKNSALAIAAIAKNLASKTWLKGLFDTINVIDDPERYGQSYIKSLASTAVPTIFGQIARAQDPTLREARTSLDAIMSKISGQREKLMPRLNIFGEEIVLQGGLGPDIVSPIYTSQEVMQPIAREMNRIRVYPEMPERKINGHELTPEQYHEYSKISGQTAKQFLNGIIHGKGWNKTPDDQKKDVIKKIFTRSRQLARAMLTTKYRNLAIPKKLQERYGVTK